MAQNRRGGDPNVFDGGEFGTLRYDFKKWGGVQGIIQDPSDEMIERYMRGMRDAAREFSSGDVDVDNMSAGELNDLMQDDDNLRIADAQDMIAELTAELCGGSPSKAELLQLPFRVRQGFLRWLQSKLINPESEAAGTTASRVTRIGG